MKRDVDGKAKGCYGIRLDRMMLNTSFQGETASGLIPKRCQVISVGRDPEDHHLG